MWRKCYPSRTINSFERFQTSSTHYQLWGSCLGLFDPVLGSVWDLNLQNSHQIYVKEKERFLCFACFWLICKLFGPQTEIITDCSGTANRVKTFPKICSSFKRTHIVPNIVLRCRQKCLSRHQINTA